MRPSRPQMFMEIAHVVAKRSTCHRLCVGAIVTHENRIISMGYNGQPPGEDHCKKVCQPGQCNTIHAEVNALRYLPRESVNDRLDMYITASPCADCAAQIITVPGIRRVFFGTAYRDQSPIDKLLIIGIDVYRVLPNGEIVDQKNNTLVTDVLG